jgi:hypothetical protein
MVRPLAAICRSVRGQPYGDDGWKRVMAKRLVKLLGDNGQRLATLMVAEEPVVMKRAA